MHGGIGPHGVGGRPPINLGTVSVFTLKKMAQIALFFFFFFFLDPGGGGHHHPQEKVAQIRFYSADFGRFLPIFGRFWPFWPFLTNRGTMGVGVGGPGGSPLPLPHVRFGG